MGLTVAFVSGTQLRDTPTGPRFYETLAYMTTTINPADTRVIPTWELCDRMRRSMRLVGDMDNSDVAEIMGVRRETVSTWLSGRRRPSYAVLVLWSDMCGVDRDWLIEGERDLYAMRDLNPQPADYGSATLARPVLRILGGGARPGRPRPAAVLEAAA